MCLQFLCGSCQQACPLHASISPLPRHQELHNTWKQCTHELKHMPQSTSVACQFGSEYFICNKAKYLSITFTQVQTILPLVWFNYWLLFYQSTQTRAQSAMTIHPPSCRFNSLWRHPIFVSRMPTSQRSWDVWPAVSDLRGSSTWLLSHWSSQVSPENSVPSGGPRRQWQCQTRSNLRLECTRWCPHHSVQEPLCARHVAVNQQPRPKR